MLLQNGLAAPLRRDGIIKLYELCAEDETQMNRNEQIRIDNVKSCFSRAMIEMAGAYDEDENDDSQGLTQYLDQNSSQQSNLNIAIRIMVNSYIISGNLA